MFRLMGHSIQAIIMRGNATIFGLVMLAGGLLHYIVSQFGKNNLE
ncbi:TPA: hypothetical protein ACNUVO_002284 [Aeromonas salmonicida subsp. pectinolytica]